MSSTTPSKRRTRRSFIVTAGTALSAPIAAAAAVPGTPDADAGDPAARLQRLEALEAIRGLNDTYGRLVTAGDRDAAAALFVDPATAALDPAVRGLLVDPVAALEADVEKVDANPLGSLEEWITIHRRATTTSPTPEATEQEIVPIADPPPPADEGTATMLPTPWTLAYITVPLSLVAGFGTLAALLGIGAIRQTRRAVRTRDH